MKEFKRCISRKKDDAVTFWRSSLGRAILTCQHKGEKQFYICLRENYFNVYWKGCSVLKYAPNATSKTYEIHHKYVGKEYRDKENYKTKKNDPYIRLKLEGEDLVFGDWNFSERIVEPAQKDGSVPLVEDYVKGSKLEKKEGEPDEIFFGEKEMLARYIQKTQPCLLDLEVAFSRKKTEEEKKRYTGEGTPRNTIAERIDLARIVPVDGRAVLQFVEVKLVNDSRLVTAGGESGNEPPEVFWQMKKYRDYFLNREGVLATYKEAAKLMLNDFSLVEKAKDKKLYEDFLSDGVVDTKPHLLIIGSGLKKLEEGKNNRNHWQILKSFFADEGFHPPVFTRSSDFM